MMRDPRYPGREALPAGGPANPLDSAFGPRARSVCSAAREQSGGYVEFTDSLYQHLSLSTIVRFAQIAERHPHALEYFPPGSKLVVGAEGERGSAWEDGYLRVYCQLKYPAANGDIKTSLREQLSFRSASGVEAAFERFLRILEGGKDR